MSVQRFGQIRHPHVLVVAHGFQSHYELGFVNGLADNGARVTLLGSDNTLAAQLRPGVGFRNIRGSQDNSRPRWRKALNMLGYYLRLGTSLLAHRGQPVAFIGIFNPRFSFLEARLIRLAASHLGMVVHNVLPHDRHTDAMREAHRRLYALPDLLLVHTPSTQAQLTADFGVDPGRVVLMPHGLNDAVCRPPGGQAQAKQQLGLGADARTVLFFGHVSPFKGLHHLLDALDQGSEFTLLMAGRCTPDDYGNAMRKRVERLVEQGRAKWFDGYVDEATIGRVFAAADVTALPYSHIDQSGVLLLSLSLGVPVLATRRGGFLDLVDERNGVFIEGEPCGSTVLNGLVDFFSRGEDAFPANQVEGTVAHLRWNRTVSGFVARLAGPTANCPAHS